MKKLHFLLLSAVCFLAAALPAAAQESVTITLKDNTTRSFTDIDSVRFVGGNFGTPTGIGVKIYVNGSTQSHDFLYSQMLNITVQGQTITVETPVITPDGGEITEATTVTITCATTGASIYYTTDGSTPSATHGTRYTAPITINETTTLSAIAVLDGVSSTVTTATFTYVDNNVNANWHSINWQANTGNMTYTPQSAGFWRLEFPHISNKTNTSWVQKEESEYGVALAIEWDNDIISNRWTAYQLHSGNSAQNVDRKDSFKEDEELPASTRSTLDDYKSSGYARGHLCPSADRRASQEQQALTYFLSNMQPQWGSHNSGQWAQLEDDVRTIAIHNSCDTLYIVKAATIDDVHINNTTVSGYYSNTYEGTTYADLVCNGRLVVPKYFYMALLAYNKSENKYYAMGIWTKHFNNTTTGADNKPHDWPIIRKESAEYITIAELEARTGLDFFCNLPDDIEAEVESTLETSYWTGCGISLNR